MAPQNPFPLFSGSFARYQPQSGKWYRIKHSVRICTITSERGIHHSAAAYGRENRYPHTHDRTFRKYQWKIQKWIKTFLPACSNAWWIMTGPAMSGVGKYHWDMFGHIRKWDHSKSRIAPLESFCCFYIRSGKQISIPLKEKHMITWAHHFTKCREKYKTIYLMKRIAEALQIKPTIRFAQIKNTRIKWNE